MIKTLRKALVAGAALFAVAVVPIATATQAHAWQGGGYGEWPVSERVSKHIR